MTTTTAQPQALPLNGSRMLRGVLVVAGSLALVLGIVGLFVPLLPTTPFILLAAACYLRAWPRAYRWLRANRYLGPFCRTREEGRVVPRRLKVMAIVVTLVSFGATIVFALTGTVARVILGVIGLAICVWIASQPERPQA